MRTNLSVLDHAGDLKITWDHDAEADRERARAEVERLRALGYAFFLADGTPADPVAAAAGTLLVRRLDPAEVIDPAPASTPAATSEAPAPRRRGRPRKARTADAGGDREVIAVRPLRGG